MRPWITNIAEKPRRWAGSKTAVPAGQVDETHPGGVGLGNFGCVWPAREGPANRIAGWLGEGSAGAGCRKIGRVGNGRSLGYRRNWGLSLSANGCCARIAEWSTMQTFIRKWCIKYCNSYMWTAA